MTKRERIRNQAWRPAEKLHRCEPEEPVVARIVWGRSGVQHIETTVVWWAGSDVYVRIKDARWKPEGVWIPAKDVLRLE